MATLVNYTTKSFIKLTPGSTFAAISGPLQFLVFSGEKLGLISQTEAGNLA